MIQDITVPKTLFILTQIHYDEVLEWRQGLSPSKKQRAQTSDFHQKVGEFIHYQAKLESRKRVKDDCTKNIAIKTLLKLAEIFE